MKVVFLGAATVHLSNWLSAFAEDGLEIVLVTLHREPHFTTVIRCIDLSDHTHGKLSYLRTVPLIRRALAEERPDLLVSYYASSYGVLAWLTRFQPRIVVTAGSDINFDFWWQAHMRLLTRTGLSGARRVVCWSSTMRQRLLALGVPGERIFELPRGIALDDIPKRRSGVGAIRIVCTRRFSRIFHHEVLLRSCRLLTDRNIPFVLRLCGGGPELARVRSLAQELDLTEAVSFFGELSYPDVLALLADSDVAVSLASKDGASASLFEAMAAGCYPVASRIPANSAWIEDGVNGRLVPPNDERCLADVFMQLSANRGELHRAAEQNRRFARAHLDLRVNTRRYCQLFESIASDPRDAMTNPRLRPTSSKRWI